MKKTRDRLYYGLKEKEINLRLNGHPEKRLPNTLSLSFYGIDANILYDEIKDNLAVSMGAACHATEIEISKVLKAMNIPLEWARGTLRFSTGKMTTESEIDNAIDTLSDSISKLRNSRA